MTSENLTRKSCEDCGRHDCPRLKLRGCPKGAVAEDVYTWQTKSDTAHRDCKAWQEFMVGPACPSCKTSGCRNWFQHLRGEIPDQSSTAGCGWRTQERAAKAEDKLAKLEALAKSWWMSGPDDRTHYWSVGKALLQKLDKWPPDGE